MFQTYDSPWPVGHEPPHVYKEAGHYLLDLERELEDQQARSEFDVERYLEIVDQMTHYIPIVYELRSLPHFLGVLQDFTSRIKCRVSMWGQPLETDEVQIIKYFANKWLQRRGGPLDCGPPEAKIVLYSMHELEEFNAQAIAIRNGYDSSSPAYSYSGSPDHGYHSY